MRRNTIITFGASLGFGILAVALARGWINDAVKSQYHEKKGNAPAVNVEPTNVGPVAVMDVDVNFGDEISPDLIRIVSYPKDAVPSGSFRNKNALFSMNGDKVVALMNIKRNEPLMSEKISGQGERAILSAKISDGMRAVSIRVNDVAGVAGFVMPGDRVDVIFVSHESGGKGINLNSDILIQNVRILGINQNLNELAETAAVAKTVTLEVSRLDAQKLMLATDKGKLSLSLRGTGDSQVELPVSVNGDKLVVRSVSRDGSTQKHKPAKIVRKQRKKNAVVTIIRGDVKDQVSVRREYKSTKVGDEKAGG